MGKGLQENAYLCGETGERETFKVPALRWGTWGRVKAPRLPCGARSVCPGKGDMGYRLAPSGKSVQAAGWTGLGSQGAGSGSKAPPFSGFNCVLSLPSRPLRHGPPPGARARRPADAGWAPGLRRAAGCALGPGDNGREGQKRVKKLG